MAAVRDRNSKFMDDSVFDFWNKLMVNMWPGMGMLPVVPFSWLTLADRGKSPWEIPLNMIQAIAGSFSALTVDKESAAGGADSGSGLVLALMQKGFDGYLELQKRCLDGAQKEAASLQDMESLGRAPAIWLESVRKLLAQVPNVEELGLRGSSKDLLARYATFSAKMSELLFQLCLPMDKASRAVVKSMKGTGEPGRLLQNPEEASGIWLSSIEDSYLDLLRSPNYTQLLHEATDAYEQYRQVRRQVYGPSAKAKPKPDSGGVEALSDEIGKLREKLEELLERVDSQAGLSNRGSSSSYEPSLGIVKKKTPAEA